VRTPIAALKRVSTFGADLPRELAQLEQNVRQKLADDDGAPIEPFSVTPIQRAAYTAKHGELVRVDPTAGGFTVLLPRPDDPLADAIRIVNVSQSTNAVTVKPLAPNVFVDQGASYSLVGSKAGVSFFPDRFLKNWIPMSQRIPAGNEGDVYFYENGAITPAASLPRVLDNTYSPVGNWPMNNAAGADDAAGGAVDVSGNAFTLTVEAGTARRTNLAPGISGCYFDGATRFVHAGFTSTLAIAGDMTLIYFAAGSFLQAGGMIVGHEDAGLDTDPNNNAQYFVSTDATPLITLGYLHEQGAGVNETKSTGPGWATPGALHLVGFTRISNVIQWYLNGRPWDTPSGTLNAPTGGSNGRFRVGGRNSGTSWYVGSMASLAVYATGLTTAQMLERYNYCFGRAFGHKPI
jgi:hypothetical protein